MYVTFFYTNLIQMYFVCNMFKFQTFIFSHKIYKFLIWIPYYPAYKAIALYPNILESFGY